MTMVVGFPKEWQDGYFDFKRLPDEPQKLLAPIIQKLYLTLKKEITDPKELVTVYFEDPQSMLKATFGDWANMSASKDPLVKRYVESVAYYRRWQDLRPTDDKNVKKWEELFGRR
jgi:hypothetical protein